MTFTAIMGMISAAFTPVILPALTLLVGWLIPTPATILARKQAATHTDEQTGKNLDTLP